MVTEMSATPNVETYYFLWDGEQFWFYSADTPGEAVEAYIQDHPEVSFGVIMDELVVYESTWNSRMVLSGRIA